MIAPAPDPTPAIQTEGQRFRIHQFIALAELPHAEVAAGIAMHAWIRQHAG